MNSGNHMAWSCNAKKNDRHACRVACIKETELIAEAVQILGTEENYQMRFYCEIEKVVVDEKEIKFYFKEGSVKVWQRR